MLLRQIGKKGLFFWQAQGLGASVQDAELHFLEAAVVENGVVAVTVRNHLGAVLGAAEKLSRLRGKEQGALGAVVEGITFQYGVI